MSIRKAFFAVIFLSMLLSAVFSAPVHAIVEDDVRAAYNAAVSAYNAQNLQLFGSYISDSYLDNGENKAAMLAEAEQEWSSQGWQPYNPTLGPVIIDSLDPTRASIIVYAGDDEEVEYLKLEATGWKLYGNQVRHRVNVSSSHWGTTYYATFWVEDPTSNPNIPSLTSVSVEGTGISGSRSLTYNPLGKAWTIPSDQQQPVIGTTIPGTPPTYTVTVLENDVPYPYQLQILDYAQDFPTNVSPTGTVSGTINFSWTPIQNYAGVHIDMPNPTGGNLWSFDGDGPMTSVVYDGPTLNPGTTYTYYLTNRKDSGAHSGVQGTFTYSSGGSTISVSGAALNQDNSPVSGATIEMVGNESISIVSGSNGAFTLNGLPTTSFSLRLRKTDFENSYINFGASSTNFTGVNAVLFPAGWRTSIAGNTPNMGLITGKVRDGANPSSFISGATVTATSGSETLPVTYRLNPDGGSGTLIHGSFFIKNVTPGAVVTATAAKQGVSFSPNPRTFVAYADGVTLGSFNGTPNPPESVWYTGRVRDFSSGTDLNGATVEYQPNTTVTMPDGSFTLAGLPKNTLFSAKATKTGYVPSYIPIQLGSNLYNLYTAWALITPSQLAAWGNTTGKGVITGRVSYTTNGNFNLSGVRVTAAGNSGGYPVFYQESTTSTPVPDGTGTATFANGRFWIFNVDPGDTVTINASRTGFTFNPTTVQPPSDGVTLIKYAGTATAYVSGVVHDLTPPYPGISNALVTVYDAANNPAGSVWSAFDGTFYLGLGALGNYSITATKPNYGSPFPQVFTLTTTGQTYQAGSLFMEAPPAPVITVNLTGGWNFISPPVQPSDTNIGSLLSPILNKVAIVWGWDSQNQHWLKFLPEGGQQNTLSTIESGKGYWIFVHEPVSFTMTGQGSVTTLPLAEGWNLIGYNGIPNTAATIALSTIAGKWSIMWAWESGNWSALHATIPQLPVPQLMNLGPGKAYWIRIKSGQACNWQQ